MSVLFKALLCAALYAAFATTDAHALRVASIAQDDTSALAQARVALSDQRLADADRLVRAYLVDHQVSAEAHYLLALTLFQEVRPKDSLAEYTRAAQLEPPSALDLRYVALDYVLLRDYADADTWITRSAGKDGSAGETWYAMGRIKYTENRFAEAVESFKKALVYLPQSVKAEDNLGLALEGLNQPEEAIRAYRQAIAWQGGSPHPSEQPLLNLGLLLTDRNELEEALSLLTQAAALAPHNSKVHAALGKLYRRKGTLPEAQAEFEQAVKAEPNDAALHFQLGQVYRKEGLEERAKAELNRAASIDGTRSSAEKQ